MVDMTRGSLPIGPNREDLLSLKTVHTYHHSSSNPEFVRRAIILCTTNKQIAAIILRHPEDYKTGGNFRAGERETPNISRVTKRKHSQLEISCVFILSCFFILRETDIDKTSVPKDNPQHGELAE